jgi:hypothetical protein
MKNMLKLLGIIALVAVIGFAMMACGDGGGGGNGGSGLGNALNLSGQVYTVEEGMFDYTFTNYSGSSDLTSNCGGDGNIQSGKLSFTIEEPDETYELDLDIFSDDYENVTASNPVDGCILYLSDDSDNEVFKMDAKVTINESAGTVSGSLGFVEYVYVEDDVTVSGKGTSDKDEESVINYYYVSKDFKLNFKEGWNAIYYKMAISGKFTLSGGSISMTQTVSLSDPTLKWVLNDDYFSYSMSNLNNSVATTPEVENLKLQILQQARNRLPLIQK